MMEYSIKIRKQQGGVGWSVSVIRFVGLHPVAVLNTEAESIAELFGEIAAWTTHGDGKSKGSGPDAEIPTHECTCGYVCSNSAEMVVHLKDELLKLEQLNKDYSERQRDLKQFIAERPISGPTRELLKVADSLKRQLMEAHEQSSSHANTCVQVEKWNLELRKQVEVDGTVMNEQAAKLLKLEQWNARIPDIVIAWNKNGRFCGLCNQWIGTGLPPNFTEGPENQPPEERKHHEEGCPRTGMPLHEAQRDIAAPGMGQIGKPVKVYTGRDIYCGSCQRYIVDPEKDHETACERVSGRID